MTVQPHTHSHASVPTASESPIADPNEHIMPGLPDSFFLAAIIALFNISFIFAEYLNLKQRKKKEYFKFNILKIRFIRGAIKSRWLRFIARLLTLAFFLFIIVAGLFGIQSSDKNITPLFTWTIWWSSLIFLILFLGKAFCYICPWEFIASLVRKLPFNKPDYKWPIFLRNIWLAIFLFIGLTWLELGYGVTFSPFYTALLGILMLILVLVPTLIFERRSFCRYGCLVGRVSGLYSLVSPLEIRSIDKDICKTCTEKNCFLGTSSSEPCPTFQCLATMDTNTYCTMCTECIFSCKKNNVAINIRSFAKDLLYLESPRIDEAMLAIIMLSLTSFHGLTMTDIWTNIIGAIESITSGSYILNFSIGMALIIAIPILAYLFFCWLTKLVSQEKSISIRTIFIHFAYSFIPIALFYHLAHNLSHFVQEGPRIIALFSDPFGFGWNIFGTANFIAQPFLSSTTIWYTEIAFILIGHIIGIFICSSIARKLFRNPFRSQIPMLVAMVLYSFGSLYLIAQPMIMRLLT